MSALDEKIAAILAAEQLRLIKRNVANPNASRAELIQAIRCGVAAWALCEATPQQLFETVERNKTSHNN